MKKILLAAMILLLGVPCLSAGESRGRMKQQVAGHQLHYLLQTPSGDAPKDGWPLLLFLHGYGECGDDLEKVKVHGPPKLISKFGSEEQKLKWLPSMAAGELRGCFSLSEPDSGSDAGALRCRAERDGGDPPLVPFEGDDRWLIGVSGEERCTPHQDEAEHEFPQRFHSLKPAVQKSGRRSP